MTCSEILTRYRRLRQISKEHHEAVLDIIAPDVLLDWARRLDLTEGKAVVLESENEMTLPEDLAIYLPSTTVEFTNMRIILLGSMLDRSEAASERSECF